MIRACWIYSPSCCGLDLTYRRPHRRGPELLRGTWLQLALQLRELWSGGVESCWAIRPGGWVKYDVGDCMNLRRFVRRRRGGQVGLGCVCLGGGKGGKVTSNDTLGGVAA